MKEFIDKLINELEKLGEHCLYMNNWQGNTAICDAIEIVNQLAEEYKVSEMPTGWIPCSERLPSVNGWYLVTNTLGIVQQQYWGANHWHKLNDEFVVAWCELPAPYTEGE